MIIEIFGPPAAGKTTFVTVLAAALRERGHVVEAMISSRPAETSAGRPQIPASAVLRRLAKPFAEVLRLVFRPGATKPGQAAELIRMLPPKSPVWFIRLSQYLLRLNTAWQQAQTKDHIVIFDQAYVQVICSMILLGPHVPDDTVKDLLHRVPRPDLLIQLEAPHAVLEARLRERSRDQGMLERYFEFDLATNLASVQVINDLDVLMRADNLPMIRASSTDQQLLADTIAAIETLRVRMPERAVGGQGRAVASVAPAVTKARAPNAAETA
jgi:thymidylate kinase